ncbi:hypothetical protein [Undibacterium griseum]|uniref:DUF3892 domain-containing protein n=1 Tax=Undibacterium griseum TaxID=2762295 RepID=A0ABR6YMJ9_9BURK|nr:hypothetical protein [Undibacterium griseum]MBC3885125.1 hypothetical protein [Undibacterium griseum]
MALFFIEAVRFDESGERVARVRWGRSKGGQVMPPAMVDEPQEVDVGTVLNTIANGDEVIIKLNGDQGIVLGPKVTGVRYADGMQGLDLEPADGRTPRLADLPSF